MKAKIGTFFLAFWISCTLLVHLSAQPSEIISRHFTMKDGLSHNYATCLLQDSQGFLWVGTESGLNKFDGYHFTTYQENPLDSNSLSNNNITCLWKDQQQRLWVGSSTGLELMDLTTEKFHHPFLDILDPVKGLDIAVHKIRERKDGKLWICTEAGIYLADPETLSVTKSIDFPQEVSRNSSRRDNLNGNNFRDIAEAADGSLWAASDDGVVNMDIQTGTTTRYRYDPDNPASLADDWARTVFVDSHDRVWVGTAYGLDLFNPEDKSFTHFLPEHLQSEPPLSHRLYVNSLLEQPDGKLRVGFSSGLYDFDPETGKFDLLLNHYIWSMYKDQQENQWLATISGLFQMVPERKKFTTYQQFGQAKMSGIASLAEDAKGQIWISGYDITRGDFKLFRFDPSSRLFFPYPYDLVNSHRSLTSNIQCMAPDSQGWLWMASPGTLEKFNPQRQNFTSISLPIDPTVMVVDSKGKVWIGEWNRLGRFDPQTETYDPLTSFPSIRVYSLLEDQKENIWIGSDAGLFRYNLKTSQLDVFKHDPADLQSLTNDKVNHLMMDQQGTLWIGTGGGLNKMISGTENNEPKFIHWRSSHSGLPHDDINQILDGGDQTLWISCGNSISHFFPQQGLFRNYDYHDGLPSQRFSRSLKSSSGEIYFGSKGLVTFQPDSLQDNPYLPPVVITGFSIHNQPVTLKDSYEDTQTWKTPLTNTIPYTHKVELTHWQNDFSLEFTALNFVNPENNLYKYKLEPYEVDWTETSASTRIARYTNISPGHYTFRIIGSNNDGKWNEAGRSLSIIIHPPWWKTWWAYALYTILGIGLLYSLRQYTINRERLQAELKIQQVEADKLRELDMMKSRFFANISHEFRTPLSLISGTVQKLKNQTLLNEVQKKDCHRIDRNAARLLELINQLLDLSKLEAGQLQPHPQNCEVTVLLGALASSFESMAEDKGITYRYSVPLKALWATVDKDKLEKIITNLLSNALKFTPAGRSVAFTASVEANSGNDDTLKLKVEDTGIGIASEHLPHIFDRFFQVDPTATRNYGGAGIGLALTRELVALLGGTIQVESRQGRGTTFQVTLPLKTMAASEGENHCAAKNADLPFSPAETLFFSMRDLQHATNTKEYQVLVVEDNPDFRLFLKESLLPYYSVMEAADGAQGLTTALKTIPDLIISDVMMPGIDGVALCQQLKTDERTSHVPFILLTAKADTSSKLLGLQTGTDDYLTKPFQLEELLVRVKNLLEGRKKLREQFGKTLTLEPQAIAVTSTDERFLQKALAIVEANMDNSDFDVETFGREIGMSRAHLHRKLKALTDQSPSELIRTLRIKRAASLLRQHHGNVSEVAMMTGFGSLNYFTKCFRQQYGKTPSEYAREDSKV